MIRILLEETDDNLDFANEVKAQLVAAYPQLATKIEYSTSWNINRGLDILNRRYFVISSWC